MKLKLSIREALARAYVSGWQDKSAKNDSGKHRAAHDLHESILLEVSAVAEATGGCAFPTTVNDCGIMLYLPGMSLRDYFAAKIISGFVVECHEDGGHNPGYDDEDFEKINGDWNKEKDPYPFTKNPSGSWSPHRVYSNTTPAPIGGIWRLVTTYEHRMARDAYKYADAMLAAREPKSLPPHASEDPGQGRR